MSAPYPPPLDPPTGRGRRSTTVIVVAVALAMVVGFAGIGLAGWAAVALFSDNGSSGVTASQPPVPSTSAEMPSYPQSLARYYEQKLDWSACGANQCARLMVPLDYADPAGASIGIAVLRAPAQQRGQRVGQLVVNPGGPGGSGVDYAASGSFTFGDTLTRYYDIVGFDPRGVGRSTPLACGDTRQTDQFLATDPDPDDASEAATLDRLTREYGEACLAHSGELARHMSTVEAAKDMDVLRAALGERQLDYLGASYGTLLGATYADLFPSHVRRMVLDGAIDPALSNEQISLGQAGGFQVALDAYLQDCVKRGNCPLGDSVGAGADRIARLLTDLDARPLPTSSGRQLTEGLATYGIFLPLYLKEYWPLLTAAFEGAIVQGNGDRLMSLSDQYTDRGANGYTSNSTAALYAVNCLDHSDSIPISQVPRHFSDFEKVAPTFGRVFAYGLSTCSTWPVQSGLRTRAMDAKGAPPIVVVGTTRDPATPYAWARSLASELDSGHLITRDGDGHTGFRQGNRCVDGAIEGFLVAGTVPKDGLSC